MRAALHATSDLYFQPSTSLSYIFSQNKRQSKVSPATNSFISTSSLFFWFIGFLSTSLIIGNYKLSKETNPFAMKAAFERATYMYFQPNTSLFAFSVEISASQKWALSQIRLQYFYSLSSLFYWSMEEWSFLSTSLKIGNYKKQTLSTTISPLYRRIL